MIYWFVVDLWVSTPWHFPLASIFLFALMQMTIGLRPSNLKVIHKRFQISASSNDFPRHDVAKTSVARFDISFQAKSISWLSVNLKWNFFDQSFYIGHFYMYYNKKHVKRRYTIDQFSYLEQTANRKMYVSPTFDGVIWIFPPSLILLFRISFMLFGPSKDII